MRAFVVITPVNEMRIRVEVQVPFGFQKLISSDSIWPVNASTINTIQHWKLKQTEKSPNTHTTLQFKAN